MFKRLFWSGSRAKFWGVTWDGDDGMFDGRLNYHGNVANAFSAASNFCGCVEGATGAKIVLAHSLGNMVVSSAIQDYGLAVDKYFMLNAAVASGTLWFTDDDVEDLTGVNPNEKKKSGPIGTATIGRHRPGWI